MRCSSQPRTERTEKITPQWANRIITTYNGLTFSDMPIFRDRYFDKLAELEGILHDEIASDDECLNHATPEEDVREQHLPLPQRPDQLAEGVPRLGAGLGLHRHRCRSIELAAISEVHRMFFDEIGLTALLDQIKFEFTDEDRDLLALSCRSCESHGRS